MKRFKRPKIDNFRHYCYECAHWTFIRDIGCAHEGVCNAIEDEPTEQDAYDKMCGLFTNKAIRPAITRRSITAKEMSDAYINYYDNCAKQA